ncbi:hypothetical protein [Calidithermus chliarophilus]|jgi:hypothetical protein|uniref:hypothetical protein n=1 Tax=Calidithermus chliarophilus TaxID=52023 RepID=UPI000484556A|nr:hypothetical protein [Calidithermus chliarophilus]
MTEREFFLASPRECGIAISLPVGTVEGLRRFAREVPFPAEGPRLEVAFELEGMGVRLHPLSLLPDRLQDVLEMGGRARWASQGICGMEAGGRLLVIERLAWLEVQIRRGGRMEVLIHELEEEGDDERRPDALHRDG